jgi:hypothetical protein
MPAWKRSRGPRTAFFGVEWARPVAIAASVTTAAALFMVPTASADVVGSTLSATAAATRVTVVVTPASRPDPYNAQQVGDPVADQQHADTRAYKANSVHARVASLNANIGQDLPAVSGVVADVTPDQLAALYAQPDLVVTPDVPVSVADASFSATRAPAAVFPQTTGATQLAPYGVDGSGVTVAVLVTGIN